ncbi:hypothetical protein [Enterococcus saccharolyticus]|uniref:hypothetical protein n=1 Tax=Enterococcus saccharolyticus TaxID=41997 RepID=UPI0039E1AFAC
MKTKQPSILFIFILITAIHVLFCNFYPPIYGYMNINGHLPFFLMLTKLVRVAILLVIIGLGFTQMQEKNKKGMFAYLALFFFNLILMFLFS